MRIPWARRPPRDPSVRDPRQRDPGLREPWKWLAVVLGVGFKLAAILALGFYAVRMSRS